MVVAAVAVGVATVAGSAIAGSEAASATKSAAQTAANQQETALNQQEAIEQPYNKIGLDATSQYENLLGTGPNSNAHTIQQALAQTPGYQFTQQQGETGILNAASGRRRSIWKYVDRTRSIQHRPCRSNLSASPQQLDGRCADRAERCEQYRIRHSKCG